MRDVGKFLTLEQSHLFLTLEQSHFLCPALVSMGKGKGGGREVEVKFSDLNTESSIFEQSQLLRLSWGCDNM